MPPPGSRLRSESARRSREAAAAERDFRDALDAYRLSDSGRIKAPPRLERRNARVGGGYRSTAGGEYDWFYSLHPKEQARIRSNWMTDSPNAVTPDEVEGAGLPIDEWVALGRGIDGARAVRTGKHVQAARYGGRDPRKLLERGRPADHGTPHHAERHEGDRVQFFTDSHGVVHPIRASESPRYSSGHTDYGDDEAF